VPVELLDDEFVAVLPLFPVAVLPLFVDEVVLFPLEVLEVLDEPLSTEPGFTFDEPLPGWSPTLVGKAVAPS
jgi:hypothetical protein